MAVNLYASRVVLDVLGVDDFGIYNVVGGIILMFSFVSGTLSTAISRFLTFELGCEKSNRLKIIFSTSMTIQVVLAIIIFVLAELAGYWFLNNKMNIPANRMNAANWVLQCSIFTFVINLISIPYTAVIIAHERMKAFAYVSIIEVVLKLGAIFLLYVSFFDKLATYAILLLVVAVIVRIVYGIYCKRCFEECVYNFILDRKLLKEMGSFSGWNMLGTGAYVFNTQGVNIAINLFFGVTVNAARAIATQADAAVKQFVTNFTTAINPQITKSYAAGNMNYMYSLICKGSKYSYLLMLFFVIPFFCETEAVLKLWLKEIPEFTSMFLRLTILGSMVDILGNSTANAAWATGRVKLYYIIIGGVGCLVFPISYILFELGFSVISSYVTFIIVYIIIIMLKLQIVKMLINFPILKFIKEVFGRIFPVSILACLIPSFICYTMPSSIVRLILVVLTSTLSILCAIYFVGLEHDEKLFIKNRIVGKLKK